MWIVFIIMYFVGIKYMNCTINESLFAIMTTLIVILVVPDSILKNASLIEWVQANKDIIIALISFMASYFIVKLVRWTADWYER